MASELAKSELAGETARMIEFGFSMYLAATKGHHTTVGARAGGRDRTDIIIIKFCIDEKNALTFLKGSREKDKQTKTARPRTYFKTKVRICCSMSSG